MFKSKVKKCLFISGEMNAIDMVGYVKRFPKFGDLDILFMGDYSEVNPDVVMRTALKEGYDLVLVSNYCIKRAKPTGSQKGGCTEITNRGEIHDKSVDQLIDMFPDVCHVRKSEVYGGTKAVTVKFKRELTQKLF